MARRGALLIVLLTGLATGGSTAAPSAEAAPSCAPGVTQTTPGESDQPDTAVPTPASPTAGQPCWVDQDPYPFGSDGNPVDTSTPRCAPNSGGDALTCYLTVTSFAFRGYNRGLAATSGASGNAFGVWLFNGTRWFPDPTFPGQRTCQGDTVLWAGKLDYWLVGAGSNLNWPSICRFDGVNFEWEPLSIPSATLARVTTPPSVIPAPGGITSGTCFTWDNCWFFGTYGAVLHWDGNTLADASPDPFLTPWLSGEYTAAAAQRGVVGTPLAFAAMGTASRAATAGPLPGSPDGTPQQLFSSSGGPFAATPFAAPTQPAASDPNRTDIVSVDVAADGGTWLAGNPAGFRARAGAGDARPGGRAPSTSPDPSPLMPMPGTGPPCAGPPISRFQYLPDPQPASPADAFLWSAVSGLPGGAGALAAGRIRPGTPGQFPNEDGSSEPVLVAASCDGTTTATRFIGPDPTVEPPPPTDPPVVVPPAMAAADRQGSASAVVANATNDGWAATTPGSLRRSAVETVRQRPHLYRFSDGTPVAAAPVDDIEPRPLALQIDPPAPIEFVPAPFVPPLPAKLHTSRDKKSKPAVYGIHSRLDGYVLHLIFRIRRKVTIGAIASRHGRIVARARLKTFKPGRGQLILKLDAKRYPTAIKFTNDLPTARITVPHGTLHGVEYVSATANAIKGRTIKSALFEYSVHGSGLWTQAVTRHKRPLYGYLKLGLLAAGNYDFRVIVTDSKKVAGVSPVIRRRVDNPMAKPLASAGG